MKRAARAVCGRAVLFDLDGTLADTAPDLAYVLNLQLRARGRPELPVEAAAPVCLARRARHAARGLRPDAGAMPAIAALRDEFLDCTQRNLFRETRLFPGMPELLAASRSAGLPWGIVTNKLERFTLPLVEALGLAQRAGCVVSGDTTAPRQAPSRSAAGGEPAHRRRAERLCLRRRRRARRAGGHAAGMTPVVALYGYLGDGKPPHEWGADASSNTPGPLETASGTCTYGIITAVEAGVGWEVHSSVCS